MCKIQELTNLKDLRTNDLIVLSYAPQTEFGNMYRVLNNKSN